MPEEIVDDGGLDRQRRGDQIVEVQPGLQHEQSEQLHGYTYSAYEIELEPAHRDGTPGSLRVIGFAPPHTGDACFAP